LVWDGVLALLEEVLHEEDVQEEPKEVKYVNWSQLVLITDC
jgi:hypothetical protein